MGTSAEQTMVATDRNLMSASCFISMINKEGLRIHEMTKDERSRLETLDTAFRSESVREHIRSIVVRVREQLALRKDALMSWEPFPLDVFGTRLPPEIRS